MAKETSEHGFPSGLSPCGEEGGGGFTFQFNLGDAISSEIAKLYSLDEHTQRATLDVLKASGQRAEVADKTLSSASTKARSGCRDDPPDQDSTKPLQYSNLDSTKPLKYSNLDCTAPPGLTSALTTPFNPSGFSYHEEVREGPVKIESSSLLAGWACRDQGYGMTQPVRSQRVKIPPQVAVPQPKVPQQQPTKVKNTKPQRFGNINSATATAYEASPSSPASFAGMPTGESSDGLLAVRTLMSNLIASLPAEGIPVAQHMLSGIAANSDGGVQPVMDGIKVLRWLKAYIEAQPPGQPLNFDQLAMGGFPPQQGAYQAAASQHAGDVQRLPPRWGQHTWPVPSRSDAAYWANAQHKVDTAGWASPQVALGMTQAAVMAKKHAPTIEPTQAPQEPATLRSILRDLQAVELGRIFLVRKINRLGFAAQDILRKHFSKYGSLENVLVAHSHVKCCYQRLPSGHTIKTSGPIGPTRLRPSGLGFVVMQKTEDVDTILRLGQDQVIQGVFVRVCKFEHRAVDDANDGEAFEDEA